MSDRKSGGEVIERGDVLVLVSAQTLSLISAHLRDKQAMNETVKKTCDAAFDFEKALVARETLTRANAQLDLLIDEIDRALLSV